MTLFVDGSYIKYNNNNEKRITKTGVCTGGMGWEIDFDVKIMNFGNEMGGRKWRLCVLSLFILAAVCCVNFDPGQYLLHYRLGGKRRKAVQKQGLLGEFSMLLVENWKSRLRTFQWKR